METIQEIITGRDWDGALRTTKDVTPRKRVWSHKIMRVSSLEDFVASAKDPGNKVIIQPGNDVEIAKLRDIFKFAMANGKLCNTSHITAHLAHDGDIDFVVNRENARLLLAGKAGEIIKDMVRTHQKITSTLPVTVEVAHNFSPVLHAHRKTTNRVVGDSGTGFHTEEGFENAGEGSLLHFADGVYHQATSRHEQPVDRITVVCYTSPEYS